MTRIPRAAISIAGGTAYDNARLHRGGELRAHDRGLEDRGVRACGGSRGAGGAAILLLQSGQQLLHVLCLRSRLRLLVHNPPLDSRSGVTVHPAIRSNLASRETSDEASGPRRGMHEGSRRSREAVGGVQRSAGLSETNRREAMTMPGFNAETALYRTSGCYRSLGTVAPPAGAVPQLVDPTGTVCGPCIRPGYRVCHRCFFEPPHCIYWLQQCWVF